MNENEVEIFIDPYVVYYFPYQTIGYGNDAIFEIPEDYIDSIHGPISKFSCAFYKNGLRIGNDYVEQVGRLHFRYADGSKSGGNVSFYLSDRNYIIDTDDIVYGSDYYLYNFIGCNAIKEALDTTISGSKYIDAGANKEFTTEAYFRTGSSASIISFPEGMIVNNTDIIHITINGVEVNSADIHVDNKTDPVKVTINNPSKYLTAGVASVAKVNISSWFSWEEVLNNDGLLFSREKINEMIDFYNRSLDPSVKAANALKDKPYLMRTFLSQFGTKKYNYNISYNGYDTTVKIVAYLSLIIKSLSAKFLALCKI